MVWWGSRRQQSGNGAGSPIRGGWRGLYQSVSPPSITRPDPRIGPDRCDLQIEVREAVLSTGNAAHRAVHAAARAAELLGSLPILEVRRRPEPAQMPARASLQQHIAIAGVAKA